METEPEQTVGADLGDRFSHYYVLDHVSIEEQKGRPKHRMAQPPLIVIINLWHHHPL